MSELTADSGHSTHSPVELHQLFESDALAKDQAQPAFEQFMHNFTYRYVRRGQPNRYADRADFVSELQRGRLLVGSPATVRDQLATYLEESGANYFVGSFQWGDLTHHEAMHSMELFATEVMPYAEVGVPAG